MSKNVFVLHHLGMGDHFHCNGMVRFFLDGLSKDCCLYLFCWNRNKSNVEYLYRDDSRVVVIPIPDDINELDWVADYLDSFSESIDDVLVIGYDEFGKVKREYPEYTCDQCFYHQLDIPYEYRFNKFYYERDTEEEERVYDKLVGSDDPYVFLHDIPEKGYVIDENKINKNYRIIRNDVTESIFNFRKILENAREIHCIESSFRCFVEGVDTSNSAHYFHEANREFKQYDKDGLKDGTSKEWTYIKYD